MITECLTFEDITSIVTNNIIKHFSSEELCNLWNERIQPWDGRTLVYNYMKGFDLE